MVDHGVAHRGTLGPWDPATSRSPRPLQHDQRVSLDRHVLPCVVLDVLPEIKAVTLSAEAAELPAIQALAYVAAANPDQGWERPSGDLSGTITVKMVVEGNGRVSRSRVQAPHYLFSQGVLACVQGALRSLKFPATGAPTLVTLPVNFH